VKRDIEVLIVGAGPTGLALAAALVARGVRALVVERAAAGANTSRAAVVHARTLEVLEPIGAAGRLVALGVHARGFTVRDRDRILVPVRFDGLPTRYPYALMVSQATTESVLRERLAELGGEVLWQRGLADLEQDESGVTALLADGSRVRSRFLVGADGMHSTVRSRIGMAFPGGRYAQSFSLGDVRLEGPLPRDEVVLYFSPDGLVVVAPLPEGLHRVVATVATAPEHPDAAYLQALLDARGPRRERALVREVLWGSRFFVHHRLAEGFRAGRVLLAGDAAHVHSPAGGQGMNTGIQDAMALADALAAALRTGADSPLDTYGAARRPIAKDVIALADRLTRVATIGHALRPPRNALLHFLAHFPGFRRQLACRLSGLNHRPHAPLAS
jgi:2-polyprenyl-6-methoxyphenol hydroxylase-like FAD-dependent oxidoreductase